MACQEDAQLAPLKLCNPEIRALSAEGDSGYDIPPATIDGGLVRIDGFHFWRYFSGASVTSCAEDWTIELGETPLPDAESSASFPQLFDLEVLIDASEATVLAASEIERPTTYDDLEGTTWVSNCDTCRACIVCNDLGCGGCRTACLGCTQRLLVDMDPLPSLSLDPDADPEAGVDVPLVVLSASGQAAASLTLAAACRDQIDNDGDGLIDDDDPECVFTGGWSERSECNDGLDNDRDGLIDAEDPACGLGISETGT